MNAAFHRGVLDDDLLQSVLDLTGVKVHFPAGQ